MKFFKEFKAFISRGNVLQLAIAFVMGTIFTAIVMSLVNDIFMPLISLIGGKDIASWKIMLKEVFVIDKNGNKIDQSVYLYYGRFIQAIINFLVISLVLFIIMKIALGVKNYTAKTLENFKKKEIVKEEKEIVKKKTTEELLEEIRDLLKNTNDTSKK